jgi:hypothetical protein
LQDEEEGEKIGRQEKEIMYRQERKRWKKRRVEGKKGERMKNVRKDGRQRRKRNSFQ